MSYNKGYLPYEGECTVKHVSPNNYIYLPKKGRSLLKFKSAKYSALIAQVPNFLNAFSAQMS